MTATVLASPFSYEAIFKKIIVLDVEHDYVSNRIKYTVACKKFKVVEEGYMIPEYKPVFECGNINPRWEKV